MIQVAERKEVNRFFIGASSSIGAPMDTLVSIVGRDEYLCSVAQDLFIDVQREIAQAGAISTGFRAAGLHLAGRIEVFDDSMHVLEHERWHKLRYDSGFRMVLELGYTIVDESMANSIGDYFSDDESTVRKRLMASRRLLTFFESAYLLTQNRGLKQADYTEMGRLVTHSGFDYSSTNWVAFLSCVESLGVYSLCVDVINEHGLDGARSIFLETIGKIEDSGEMRRGLDFLAGQTQSGCSYPLSIRHTRDPLLRDEQYHSYAVSDGGEFSVDIRTSRADLRNVVIAACEVFRGEIDTYFDREM